MTNATDAHFAFPVSSPGAALQPRVSVVICTRNRGDSAVSAVESVLKNSHTNFEVLVVDQSTNAQTHVSLQPFLEDPRFRYVPMEGAGLGRARNLGLSSASCDIVLFTDDDCTVPMNWIDTMERAFQRDPRIAVVFCNVEGASHDATAGFIPAYVRPDAVLVKSAIGKCTARGIGAGLALRKNAAIGLGGFDELLGAGAHFPSCEDGDIAIRSILKGWWLHETNEVSVLHHGFRTWKEGKSLSKRDWIGIGAAYSKPLKCGYWSTIFLILYEVLVAMHKPIVRLATLRSPQGAFQVLYFLRGFIEGLLTPVDREALVFRQR